MIKIIFMLLLTMTTVLNSQEEMEDVDVSIKLDSEKIKIIEKLESENTINSIILNKSVEWKKEYTLVIKYKGAKIFYVHFDSFTLLKDFLKTKNLRNDKNVEILKMVSKRNKKDGSQSYSDLRIIEYRRE